MKILLSIALVATVFLSSCDQTKQVIDAAGNVQLSGTYIVNSIDNSTITTVNPTITFAALDRSVNGSTGCNSFFGNYTLDLYAMDFGDIASTEKSCDAAIMETEFKLLQALEKTGSYSLQEDVLTLYSKTDRSILLSATKQRKDNN